MFGREHGFYIFIKNRKQYSKLEKHLTKESSITDIKNSSGFMYYSTLYVTGKNKRKLQGLCIKLVKKGVISGFAEEN